MSLTDDWKAGKLDEGFYYIRLKNGSIFIAELEWWHRPNAETGKAERVSLEFAEYDNNCVAEVLASVPSYDELLRLKDRGEKKIGKNKPMNNSQQPYSPEIRAKYCKPQEDINLGERYCKICGCVLSFDEEDICDDCFFESSRPLTDEEIKQLEEQSSEGGSNVV